MVPRSRKRQRLNLNAVSTDATTFAYDSECGVVLETLKERFLVVRHCKNTQPAGVDGVNSDKPTFTISLIQGEVEVSGVSTSSFNPSTKLELTPVLAGEEPRSPLPTPEQPTKEPSPVEPLPPVSTTQGLKELSQDPERGRSTSVVDMDLDTPVSVTPTATTNSDIPILGKIFSNGDVPMPNQDAVLAGVKAVANADQLQSETVVPQEGVPSTGDVSARAEITPLKPPSPPSATVTETARPEAPPLPSAPVPRTETQDSSQVKLKLQVLQRNVRGEDLIFGDDGLGVLSADVDPLDNTKKGWLIEAPRWRRYGGRISDSIVVD